ncbi:type III pantothenate kinase [Algoriphagus halophytocola]|uniref:Type III pantothenate kinase n=1 Tax=Algoriphagus halophytocola TaxID=2991499 RepID=A0ABY6MD72_9BACT|nr:MULTISPECIES: type III pantothenate kinase [unclassified Algoriphagus]UZD21680.1 type III pantothenate kinase [Algoriphagus sp. TR-M5]WBL42892.1 type III pantothenate kinase [Algoriphagus sp. TR-M9]
MTNLIIDIGNTRIKSARFDQEKLLDERSFEQLDQAVSYWKSVYFSHCLISSVRWNEDYLSEVLPFKFQFLSQQTKLPIQNGYGSPATLGLDRIAAAIGGWSFESKGPVLAVDLGSCITFDLVDEENVYRGGAISPGVSMRAQAMHTLTARLPLVALSSKSNELIGDNTITCMQIGIWRGVEFEILGQIEAYRKKYPKIQVFVCGGDAQSFDSLAKDHIFVVPNLVLHGLNAILNHNVE